jgi:LPXTG-site transpeptidase (sortase) family protein
MNKNLEKVFHNLRQRKWSLILIIAFLAGAFLPSTTAVEALPLSSSMGVPAMVTDIYGGDLSSNPKALTAFGNMLFFYATERRGEKFYMTVPPYNSVVKISDIQAGNEGVTPEEIAIIDKTVFFTAQDGTNGVELWKTEPPYNTAYQVANINQGGSSYPKYFKTIGTTLFFSATDGKTGYELWKTAPPYTSATQVADLLTGGGSSNPHSPATIGWTLFFVAINGTGREVWKSEPPYNAEKTVMVSNIDKGGDPSADHLTPIDTTLLFTARESKTKPFFVWKSEPPYTPDTTVTVNDLESEIIGADPNDLIPLGSTLYYSAFTFTSGNELHMTHPPYDTTTTFRVADIYPGYTSTIHPIPFSSNPAGLTPIGSTMLFSARDAKNGYQLWKTDPPYDDDATVTVRAINPAGDSNPHNLTAIGASLYFTADDGVYGKELWRCDPPYVAYTTNMLADVNVGRDSSDPAEMTAIGSSLFFSADDGVNGRELWRISSNIYLPATGFAPNTVTALQKQKPDQAYDQSNDLSLDIPALSVKTPLVGVPMALDGWKLDWLWDQAGYLEGTAFPTWQGNSAITGHVYLPNGKPGPFANLRLMKYDDSVVIHAWGQRYIYKVRSVTQVKPRDLSILSPEKQSWITLVTCQGYDDAKKDYRFRLAVRAVLVEVKPEN